MKIFIIFSFILSLLISDYSLSQWMPDVRLTNNVASSNGSLSSQKNIAVNGSIVHVVWSDQRDGDDEIYYKRSSDGGLTWSADRRLTISIGSSVFPSVCASGNDVHLVWNDKRSSNFDIFYKHSSDAGITWEADKRLTINSSSSEHPSVSASGNEIQVAWFDDRDENRQIYYKHSDNGGISWSDDTRMSDNIYISKDPSITSSGANVHLVWEEYHVGHSDLFYRRSTDNGLTWSTQIQLSTFKMTRCSASSYENYVHLVWEDDLTATGHIIYKRSTDNGISWEADVSLTGDYFCTYPCVTSSGSKVHINWMDYRDGTNSELYYRCSTNYGSSWNNEFRLTNNSARSELGTIAAADSLVHVVWQDNRDGNTEIYYKRKREENNIGVVNISTEIPEKFLLFQNYPNPFNPLTKFRFQVSKNELVKVIVFDITGREVENLVNKYLSPGTYEASFDGSRYSSGIYFYRLEADNFTQTNKMILIK